MATKKVNPSAIDRQAAKALLVAFLEDTFVNFPARLPAELRRQERADIASAMTMPNMRAAFADVYLDTHLPKFGQLLREGAAASVVEVQ